MSLAERGKRPFRVVDLIAIASAFEVSMIRLLQPHARTHPGDAVLAGRIALDERHLLSNIITAPRGVARESDLRNTWPDEVGDLGDRITSLVEFYESRKDG